MRRRYDNLVELARVCWREPQTVYTREAARTLRRIARQYLQEAAKLDGGRLPDIGLACLKEARQANASQPPRSRAGRWMGKGEGDVGR